MKKIIASACFALVVSSLCAARALAEETIKHPVFLLCPQKERYSAWSLALVTEKSNPSKPLKLVLEKLNGKNAKDETYSKVLEAQSDPNLAGLRTSPEFGKAIKPQEP